MYAILSTNCWLEHLWNGCQKLSPYDGAQRLLDGFSLERDIIMLKYEAYGAKLMDSKD